MNTQEYYSDLVEKGLADLEYPAEPDGLYEPIRYTLQGGGKRLRPTLLLAAFEACQRLKSVDAKELPLAQALGLEMFHNFTLLHDDVMDRADVRRGRPTVHRRWNDSVAILSGDAMLTLATQLMSRGLEGEQLRQVLDLFNRTAMEIYQGQQYDMDFETQDRVSVEQYLDMIRLKTAVLLGCACAMGAILAGAPTEVAKQLYRYGEQLGLAFQLQDDYLDTYGDPAIFGKEIGGDIANEKKTWLWINAKERASEAMERVVAQKLSDFEKLQQVRAIYDSLGLPQESSALIQEYTDKALKALEQAQLPAEGRQFFQVIAQKALKRNH